MNRVRLPGGSQFGPALLAANRALSADTSGQGQIWELPPGEQRLAGGIQLGAAGRDLVIQGSGSTLVVDDAAGGLDNAAVRLTGRRVRLSGLTVRAASSAALTGIDVIADSSRLDGLSLRGLRGDAVTAVRVRGARARIGELEIDGVEARIGLAEGLDLLVSGRAEVSGARLRGLIGDAVRAVRVQAAGGQVRDVALSDLRPRSGDAGLITVSVDAALEVSGLSSVREISAADPAAALALAQAELVASPAGSEHTWLLPSGTLGFAAGLVLGAPGRGLRLRGRRAGGPADSATELRVGVGARFAGDLVALDLTGDRVSVDELQVRAEATGAVTGVRVRADQVELSDLALRGLRGIDVLGLDLETAPGGAAGVVDLTVDDLVGSGTATGARLRAGRLVLTNHRISRVSAASAADGLDARAGLSLAAAAIRVSRLSGDRCRAAVLRVLGGAGELSVLDLGVDQVRATGADAIGAALISAGDVAGRGLSASGVTGARSIGLLLAAAGDLDWDGGTVADVRGTVGGATGARLLVGPAVGGRAGRVRVEGVRIEAVLGAEPGSVARPPRSWLDLIGSGALLSGEAGPVLPGTGAPGHAEEVCGLAVIAAPAAESDRSGAIDVVGCVLHRISGTALQVDAEDRPVVVRGVEAWTSVRGGWIDGEDVLLAQVTWHRHRTGLELGPATVQLADVIITDIELGLPVIGGDTGDLALAAFTGRSQPPQPGEGWPFRWAALELAVPADLGPGAEVVRLYLRPGPRTALPASVVAGGLAPATDIDLRLPAGSPLHRLARRVPGDGADPAFLGAWPDVETGCTLRDPLLFGPAAAPVPSVPGPLVNYLARDARSLLAVMLERARVTMPQWTDTNPADQTRMLMELLANRLDRLAYRQEVAVAEGFVGVARLRRSVEDHARLVDYRPDPGLSATAMLRFDLAGIGPCTLPADTVVVNRDPSVEAVVFTTESALPFRPELTSIQLAGPVRRGATSAELVGHLQVPLGRWMILAGVDPEHPDLLDRAGPAHVLQVTASEPAGEITRVFWDFRRAAPTDFDPERSRLLANVVPAHHGMPLTPLSGLDGAGWGSLGDLLRPWREQLTLTVDNADGLVREVRLPHDPISVQTSAWPFPGEPARQGEHQLSVQVDGEPWTLVESLTGSGPFDEHLAIRSALDGGSAIRAGDGVNGAALPRGTVRFDVGTRIGLGVRGNVGVDVLTQVLSFGETGDLAGVLPGVPDREQELLRRVSVTNPLPAVGGRDPEDLERVRARAPLAARQGLSAVVPADYERLLGGRREVAGVRARYRRAGLRDVVRVTVLLADEDGLTAAGVAGTAERRRRWTQLRLDLERARLLGTDVELMPPVFVPLDLDVIVDAGPGVSAEPLRAAVIESLAGTGGLLTPDASGLGGDVRVDAVYRQVSRVPGVAASRVRRLRRLLAGSPEHAGDGLLPVADDEVAVLRDPLGRAGRDGLLTVTVCGGVS